MPEGLVLWGVKSIFYVLEQSTGKQYKCVIKGKIIDTDFKIKGRIETAPIVAGDRVIFEKVDEQSGRILKRKERQSEFKRLKENGRVVQTLFANADNIIIVDSIAHPPLRPYFIDRCLFTADYMGINAVIVFNKIDLLTKETEEFYNTTKNIYTKLGYHVLETSIITNAGINDLKEVLTGKISSLNGRSGVGKSSLIKALDDSYSNIKIGEINKKYDRGIHSTSFSMIYPLKFGAYIIDTPGIRELSIFIDKSEDIARYIRDFIPYQNNCKFMNCQHVTEPDCAVLEALDKKEIEGSRYESYLRMRETVFKLDDSKI